VDEVWILVKCICGNLFGSRKASFSSCPRCGSSKGKTQREFQSPKSLAEAVAASNLPLQISQEVESRIAAEQSRRAVLGEKTRGGPEAIRSIMRQSTGSDGRLTIKKLSSELEKEGYAEPSAEQVIGQAEMEGILVMADSESWYWL
jgi:predicted  nucleic acid-binding Zn-ribbon protein